MDKRNFLTCPNYSKYLHLEIHVQYGTMSERKKIFKIPEFSYKLLLFFLNMEIACNHWHSWGSVNVTLTQHGINVHFFQLICDMVLEEQVPI
jgi:hypothetical protein